jgi:hypothetical protein
MQFLARKRAKNCIFKDIFAFGRGNSRLYRERCGKYTRDA